MLDDVAEATTRGSVPPERVGSMIVCTPRGGSRGCHKGDHEAIGFEVCHAHDHDCEGDGTPGQPHLV